MAISPSRLARAECTVEALIQVMSAVCAAQPDLVRNTFDEIFPDAFTDAAFRTGHDAYIRDVNGISSEVFLDILGDLS